MRRCILLIALLACSEKKKQEPAATPAPTAPAPTAPAPGDDKKPPAEPPKPAAGTATADLVLTGSVEAKLTGTIATCGQVQVNGVSQGMMLRVNTPELELAIIASTDAEMADPKMVLNVQKPKPKSYAHDKGGTITLEKGVKATLDTDLRAVVGGQTVHVKGTISCPPA